MHQEIKSCRICGNTRLEPLVSLGEQSLTGVFPATRDAKITRGPLALVKCAEGSGDATCGLVQLQHSYPADEMYGMNYGYRSGLNAWMVEHLRGIVAGALARVTLGPDDVVLDIGSNDSTLLRAYPHEPQVGAKLLGIDPTGVKLAAYYPAHVQLVADFFTAARFRQAVGDRKAKIVTSIAMVYDLERPETFFADVADILADDGVWVFEQSYAPTMVELTSYDTICHEHVEYYGLRQIKWLCDRTALRIVDVELNDANGGSFRVTAAKRDGKVAGRPEAVAKMLADESAAGFDTPAPYEQFRDRVSAHRRQLLDQLQELKKSGKRVIGTGASTKGNVILQYCGVTPDLMTVIAEINEDKFGCFTPGTGIPIVSEDEARKMNPDYKVVLPWHFRAPFLRREAAFMEEGGKLIFPLPKLEIVGKA